MSNSVICRGGRASTLAPPLPRVVTTNPAFESLESDFRTKVGSAFTLSARVAEEISSPWQNPSAAMMCAATANWTLFADMKSPALCDAQKHNWLYFFFFQGAGLLNPTPTFSLLEKGVPKGKAGRLALSVAGDSSEAKAAVLHLIDDLGFDPIDG